MIYRDIGPERSHIKVREKLGVFAVSMRTIEEWSARHAWVQRAQAYDDHMERLARREHEKIWKGMSKRHAQLGVMMQNMAVRRLGNFDPSRMSPLELARFVELGVKIERAGEMEQITGRPGADPGELAPTVYVIRLPVAATSVDSWKRDAAKVLDMQLDERKKLTEELEAGGEMEPEPLE